MVERSFEAARVTVDASKFGFVLGALEPAFAQEVRDIIVAPPEVGAYALLKSELTRRLSATQEQKTRRLLEHEERGDRKPSQFLRHLRTLAGNVVSDEVLRTLWIGRLPRSTQVVLATQKDTPLDKVADLADAIDDFSTRPSASEVHSPKITADSMLRETIAELRRRMETLELRDRQPRGSSPFSRINRPRRQHSRSRSRARGTQPEDTCWYHTTFGANAQKCKAPCNFAQGNALGSN